MQPDNAIIGDANGIDLPQAKIPDEILVEEKKMAKYSQSAEFKRLKEYMEGRIEFFQNYLPDGRAINALDPEVDLGQQWKLANLVIAEFNLVLNEYARIKGVVDDAERTRGV